MANRKTLSHLTADDISCECAPNKHAILCACSHHVWILRVHNSLIKPPVISSTMEVNPLSIILVKSDSKGDRLLFRYPFESEVVNDIFDQKNGKRNHYALQINEDLLQTPMPQTSNIHKGHTQKWSSDVCPNNTSIYNIGTL